MKNEVITPDIDKSRTTYRISRMEKRAAYNKFRSMSTNSADSLGCIGGLFFMLIGFSLIAFILTILVGIAYSYPKGTLILVLSIAVDFGLCCFAYTVKVANLEDKSEAEAYKGTYKMYFVIGLVTIFVKMMYDFIAN